jgi:hypothetical protein
MPICNLPFPMPNRIRFFDRHNLAAPFVNPHPTQKKLKSAFERKSPIF